MSGPASSVGTLVWQRTPWIGKSEHYSQSEVLRRKLVMVTTSSAPPASCQLPLLWCFHTSQAQLASLRELFLLTKSTPSQNRYLPLHKTHHVSGRIFCHLFLVYSSVPLLPTALKTCHPWEVMQMPVAQGLISPKEFVCSNYLNYYFQKLWEIRRGIESNTNQETWGFLLL